MRKRSQKNKEEKKRLDPTIAVALIGLIGTIIAALLASPLLDRWFPAQPVPVSTQVKASNTLTTTQPSQTATGPQIISQPISLNQTVTGTLYGPEAVIWTFSEGPATVTIILDVGPFGDALIIVKDPSGVDRAYMDQQKKQGVTQLVNFFIPTEGNYTIWVRNAANEQADYTLTVQDALTPPPP
jgi:hypothetical protein